MVNARYILSVDVEDYFQVEAFAREVSRDDWDSWPSRVEDNTRRLLDLFDTHGAKATHFVLGWVARKFPALVREIQNRGHEVACHSFWHRTIYSLTPDVFRQDLREARDALEQAGSRRVLGYRAPTWSITAKSLWALDILSEEGFLYDSSIFPIHHDNYGLPDAKRFAHRVDTAGGGHLMEFPPATIRLLGVNCPTGGGGYLRLLPYWYNRWALKRLQREQQATIVIYCHPWEVDPGQPRIASRWKSRLRHYRNLAAMEGRLRGLLESHSFQPFCDLPEIRAAMEAQRDAAC